MNSQEFKKMTAFFEEMQQKDASKAPSSSWEDCEFKHGDIGYATGNGNAVLFISTGSEAGDKDLLGESGLGEKIYFSYGTTPLGLYYGNILPLDIEAQKAKQAELDENYDKWA